MDIETILHPIFDERYFFRNHELLPSEGVRILNQTQHLLIEAPIIETIYRNLR